MKGLELSRRFYEEYGKPMLENFEHLLPYLAVGLAGSGSECYGYDDEISKDHDFKPAFCVFVPDSIDECLIFELERAYDKLPKEFLGFGKSVENPVGENRRGVIRIGDFFEAKVGSRDGNLTVGDWFSIPEFYLLEATNGEIFSDNYGEMTEIRERLKYFPEDVRLKKLAGHLFTMGQSGQYNYARCISRNDTAAAQLTAFEFAKSAMAAAFLIEKRYMPYYKWSFCALREFSPKLAEKLEFLISTSNDGDNAKKKCEVIEEVCRNIVEDLVASGLSHFPVPIMQRQAYLINDGIKDVDVRNAHILCAI